MALAAPDAATPVGDLTQIASTGTDARNKRGNWRRAVRSRRFLAGISIIAFFAVLGIVGPLFAPYDPTKLSHQTLSPPSAAHWLGTTQTGQDVLSQLLAGTGSTLLIGFLAGTIATVLSVLIGVTAGYLGGIADELLSMLGNIFLVIPALPLLIVLTGYLPNGNAVVIAVVISITAWAWGSRVLRAQTLSMRRRDYVEAARVAGERTWRVILFEILPNQGAILAANFLFTVLFAVLTQVSLAFLGLVDVSQWSWGVMLYWAQQNDALAAGAWWWFVPPGLCVALLGTGLALANFGIDEFINPRLRAAGLTRRRGDARAVRSGYTPVRLRHPGVAPAAVPAAQTARTQRAGRTARTARAGR